MRARNGGKRGREQVKVGGANSTGEHEEPLEQLDVFYCFHWLVKKRVNQALANKIFANTWRMRHNKTFDRWKFKYNSYQI